MRVRSSCWAISFVVATRVSQSENETDFGVAESDCQNEIDNPCTCVRGQSVEHTVSGSESERSRLAKPFLAYLIDPKLVIFQASI